MTQLLRFLTKSYTFFTGQEDVLCSKIKQFDHIDNKELKNQEIESDIIKYGSVGKCVVNKENNTITKKIYIDIETISNQMNFINKINFLLFKNQPYFKYIAESVKLEGDLIHEHKMLSLFYNAWKDHPYINVPKPIGGENIDQLTMEYYNWKRLNDFEKVPKNILKLMKEFNDDSIHKYKLVHGDISVFNILVSEDMKSICVIDYGLSSEISEEQYIDMCDMKNEHNTSFGSELIKAWTDVNHEYTKEWGEYIKKNFSLYDDYDIKSPEVSTLLIRSLVNMVMIMIRFS